MSCCGKQDMPVSDPNGPPRPSGRASTLLASAGVQPIRHQTRDADRSEVLLQREAAAATAKNLKPTKQPTRVALVGAPQLRSNRMSRLGSVARFQVVKALQETSSAEDAARLTRPNMGSAAGLVERLHSLGLDSVEMEGDGNCQFRSIADQLFGSQQHHALVRALAMAHMRAAADFFGMYFETQGEFEAYLSDMARSRTWGDELTLRACVEAFGCVAHVVTSESA